MKYEETEMMRRCVWLGVWSGDPRSRCLGEDPAACLHETHDRLLRLRSLHTYCCRLRHPGGRVAGMSVYRQRISRAALHRKSVRHVDTMQQASIGK